MTIGEALDIIARHIPTDEYDGPYTPAGNPLSVQAQADLLVGFTIGDHTYTRADAIASVIQRRADRVSRVKQAQEAFRVLSETVKP